MYVIYGRCKLIHEIYVKYEIYMFLMIHNGKLYAVLKCIVPIKFMVAVRARLVGYNQPQSEFICSVVRHTTTRIPSSHDTGERTYTCRHPFGRICIRFRISVFAETGTASCPDNGIPLHKWWRLPNFRIEKWTAAILQQFPSKFHWSSVSPASAPVSSTIWFVLFLCLLLLAQKSRIELG